MNLKQLREQGGFVSPKPVKKSITWKSADDLSGEEKEITGDVWVIKLSFGMIDELSNGADQASRNAALIHHALRLGDKGEEQMTFRDAYQLKPSLARAMIIAIAEVNALPKPKGEEAEDPKA